MGAKELLLVASGVAIGYLIFKKDLFKKTQKATENVANTISEQITQISDPKTEECEKKWLEYSKTIRPSSQESMDNMKKEFITNCLLKK